VLLALVLLCLGPSVAATPNGTAHDNAITIGVLAAGGAAGDALTAGARAAVAQINARDGVNGRPLRVVRLPAGRPWSDGARLMARLIFAEKPVALIGPSDRASAHLAAQIATRSRVPVITLSPEGSLTRAGNPWVFRALPDDTAQAHRLLSWALSDPRGTRATLVVPAGAKGRERLDALQDACRDLAVEITAVAWVPDSGTATRSRGLSTPAGPADILLLWLDPEPALAYLRALPRRGARPPIILASTRLDDRKFLAGVPAWAEGMALPLLRASATSPAVEEALGYDLVRLIAAAARRVGAEPALIREGLAAGSALAGKSGTFRFDEWGNRRGAIPVGVIRGGELIRAELQEERSDVRSTP
jgi:ABC-type branched-subunit amino acid transport system substrate-binding protein